MSAVRSHVTVSALTAGHGPVSGSPTEGAGRVPCRVILIHKSAFHQKKVSALVQRFRAQTIRHWHIERSEIAKRHSVFAALMAALPLTSLLAMIWMHFDGVESPQIATLSSQIFWLVLPSLLFFMLFPTLIKQGLDFWLSLGLSVTVTVIGYLALLPLLRRFGVRL